MKFRKILAAVMAAFTAVPFLGTAAVSAVGEVKGDVNGDRVFNLADMVMFQRWLSGNGELTEHTNADINEDGKYDVFDLSSMRKLLVDQITGVPQSGSVSVSRNLCRGIAPSNIQGKSADMEFVNSQTKFAVELLQRTSEAGENCLISPYSVMQALAMTANGADGQTRKEMEAVLGGMPMEQLNRYLLNQRRSSANNNNYFKWSLSTANSIWARNDDRLIQVRPEFIQTCVDYFDSEYYIAPFDNTTLKEVNGWVNEKTNEMIPFILEQISGDDVMYLVNAVAFEAQWATPYDKYQVSDGKFTAADGAVQDAKMLNSKEVYIGDENTDGMMKYYDGYKYAFAAMLPDESMTVDEYIAELTPEKLHSLLTSYHDSEDAIVQLPKFKYEYGKELSEALGDMGMPTAFSPCDADFSKMNSSNNVDNNIYINTVIHKTFIDLDENGTKAAAATLVGTAAGAIPDQKKPKEVIFDRPFLYCIFDTSTNIPVFIGALNSLS